MKIISMNREKCRVKGERKKTEERRQKLEVTSSAF
jgi:hypothetical protein